MELKKTAIVGAGLMGTGIAQVMATAGYPVALKDISDEVLNKSKSKIEKSLSRAAAKGKVTEEDMKNILGHITLTLETKAALEDADFVIEAVPENLELKQKVFAEMDGIAKPSAILATNAGELSISKIAEATSKQDRVIGTHWFFPPTVMRLIEVVRGAKTSQETVDITVELCKKVGKETVVCKDSPGFITSRAIGIFTAECLRILDEGVASAADIDKAIKLGFNHPMGPLEITDMAGIDTVYHGMKNLAKVYGERFEPTETMRKLYEEGNLGQKTGKGFFDHTSKQGPK
jgi:3-hydroxybutyryl-CoA dehydrogenase